MRPRPPASTTPAWASTASCSGVRARAVAGRCGSRGEDVAGAGARALGDGQRGVGGGPRDGEDRALDRDADRGVAGVGGRGHRLGDRLRATVLQPRGGEVGDVAAEHLAEDHPGVAARPQQRGARQERHARLETQAWVGGAGRAQRVAGRGDGEEHVGAGVAVGHGVDVERVDLLARRGQRVGGDVDEPGDRVEGDAVGDWLHRVGVLPGVLRPPCGSVVSGVLGMAGATMCRAPQGSAPVRPCLRFPPPDGPRLLFCGCLLLPPGGVQAVDLSINLERIGVHGGCRLRHLRQEAGLRKQPSLVAQDHEASLQPQHPARPGDRERHAQAPQRLHRLPQGRQGLPLT